MSMNPIRLVDTGSRFLLLALAVCAALGILLVLFFTGRPDPLPMSPELLRGRVVEVPRAEGSVGGGLVGSPLFWQSRRPYVADAGEEEIEDAPRPAGRSVVDDMRLVGIMAAG